MSDHVLDRLSAFLDEELPAREHDAVEGHLRGCSTCAAHLDVLRAVDAEARVLTVSVPEGYFDALPGRIRGRLEKSPRGAGPRLPVWTWAVAAALLLAVVTPLTLNRNAMLRPEPPVTYPASAAAGEADKAAAPAAPSVAGKDLDPKLEAKEESRLLAVRPEMKLRDQVGARGDRPEAAPPLASAPSPPPGETRKLQETVVPGAEAPAMSASAPRQRKAGPGGPYAQQQVPLQSQSAPAFAEAPVEAPADAPAEGSRLAASNEAARDEGLAKRDDQAAREKAVGGAAPGRVASAVASSDEKVFRLLQDAAVPTTVASLRERREAWRSFTRDFPSSPRTDEARVRVVVTGIEAWRAGGEAADLARAREDAAAYLARRDAVQAPRVRALLEGLPAPP